MFEFEITIPVGSRLIGTRTDGNKVIVVCEFLPPQQPEPEKRRPIGFNTEASADNNTKNKTMQYSNKEYNAELHDRWRALTVKQPYANDLVTEEYKDENGIVYAKKTIEVRSRNTPYRGDVLICSSANPVFPGMESGVTLGLVELYDVKPIKDFTQEDWENTRIPKDKRAKITKGYGWMMRNPRRVVEMPIKGQLGIYNLVYTKDVIIEYPRKVVLDKKSWERMRKK